ncbi:LysR family transcriptional regulator [Acidithiobacillus thiooxidans]|jgi:DNA-binding transcriptional LysR family regulator|uniref:HTH-type transcriptional activator CmpR n=1 Tax=Acidithiobacillus thiooxidans ATCC 19377 TaxID=637390 RepID=A0A543Q3T8_ACITH|nr:MULTISPECIES: LysR family transcriptional regulator [Acidithiobacillus]MDD2750956.1 LysR family transcriptional regulator [Acidithiobacillus sp.]MBE7565173.1 LysR family transcriptional regulator [Acidithiobacillus sp. HP-11]MBU2750722.1 LysR family transcriptional regulator [Acidithiobacillus thiooxidans]MBU2794497.1 LysR family transcriptional regulator [Acidithiobacillus thiooxidans]MBU2812746.1 LysR family transcriptional regulator [Acidithiobacillus thiooxidans]
MNISAEQWLTLLLLAETGSVSEVASRLHRGQPAISERLHKISEEVGEPLYIREGGSIRLTDAGQALLPDIRQLRDKISDIERQVIRRQSLQSGDLRIASTSLIANHLLPAYLQKFQSNHPDINLHIKSGVTYWQDIQLSEIDILFFEGDMDIPNLPAYYEKLPWCADEIIAIVPHDHPLAIHAEVPIQDFQVYPIIWREPSSGVRKIMEGVFNARDIQPQRFVEVADVESVGAMVQAGLGVGFITRTVFEKRLDWGLHGIRIAAPSPVWRSYIAVPKSLQRSRVLSTFMDILGIDKNAHSRTLHD